MGIVWFRLLGLGTPRFGLDSSVMEESLCDINVSGSVYATGMG